MEPFSVAFERFLKAVSQKQWDTFVSMLDEHAFIGALLPQGYIDNLPAFLKIQEAWFHGSTGSFQYKVISNIESTDLAVGSIQAIYQNTDAEGQPFVLHLRISFWFRYIFGKWAMVYDQNTIEKF